MNTNVSGDLTLSAGNSGTATADLTVNPALPGFSKRFAPSSVAAGLPTNGVCGAGSVLTGTSLLILSKGTLPPGGSCLFTVTLPVPVGAASGSNPNTTSNLSSNGLVFGALISFAGVKLAAMAASANG